MRALSRWLKREYAELRLGSRRSHLESELSKHFDKPLRLHRAGARGRDSIYLVKNRGSSFGTLRLLNPYLHRKPLAPNMPFVTLPGPERLDREWECYERGAESQLTPEPLWRAPDALLCAHVNGERLSDHLFAEPSQFWTLICAATRALPGLHKAGITHMDASLANILQDQEGSLVFIDFEYGPQPALSAGQARAYDYLRLLESSIKFLPRDAPDGSSEWIDLLDASVDKDIREANTTPLAPALERVLANRALRAGLASVFVNLRAET